MSRGIFTAQNGNASVPCARCHASGEAKDEDGYFDECESCLGTGIFEATDWACPSCCGTGMPFHGSAKYCRSCEGEGDLLNRFARAGARRKGASVDIEPANQPDAGLA